MISGCQSLLGALPYIFRQLLLGALLIIGRSPGGKAEYVVLTEVGLRRAAQSAGESLAKGERRLTSDVPVE
jgi:hypothetical protein